MVPTDSMTELTDRQTDRSSLTANLGPLFKGRLPFERRPIFLLHVDGEICLLVKQST